MPRRSAPTRVPTSLSPTAPCPCGLGASYGECCGAFHAGRSAAPTAERLMRSRYSAFAVRDAGYLLRTWFPATRPPEVRFDPDVRWTGLDVLATTGGTAFHTEGTVEFRAHFRHSGRAGDRSGGEQRIGEQRENSRFVRENGLWVYVDEAP